MQKQGGQSSNIYEAHEKVKVDDKPEWAKKPPQLRKTQKTGAEEEVNSSEVNIDSQKSGEVLPGPTESSVHAKEVHTNVQKQTQKEVSIFDVFYFRKIKLKSTKLT